MTPSHHRKPVGRLLTVVVVGATVSLLFGSVAVADVPPSVQASVDEVITQPRYANSTWGMQVTDAATGEVVYSSNANQMFVPGSIMKSFTSATALSSLGANSPVRHTGAAGGLGRRRDTRR